MMTKKIENDINRFFRGHDVSLKLFKLLYSLIARNCSPKIEVSRTQISFGEDYKYLWVWLPQTWIAKRPENSITLTILTGKKIKNERTKFWD